jgi:hypothetical protein
MRDIAFIDTAVSRARCELTTAELMGINDRELMASLRTKGIRQ